MKIFKYLNKEFDDSNNNSIICYIIITLLTLIYYYKFLNGNYIFTHDDILFSYFPLRQITAEYLLENFKFPIWNPYEGLGKLNTKWTSIPVDIFSILTIFKISDYPRILLIANLTLNIIITKILIERYSIYKTIFIVILINSIPFINNLKFYYFPILSLITVALFLKINISIYEGKIKSKKIYFANGLLIGLLGYGAKVDYYFYTLFSIYTFISIYHILEKNKVHYNLNIIMLLGMILTNIPNIIFLKIAALDTIRNDISINIHEIVSHLFQIAIKFEIGFPGYTAIVYTILQLLIKSKLKKWALFIGYFILSLLVNLNNPSANIKLIIGSTFIYVLIIGLSYKYNTNKIDTNNIFMSLIIYLSIIIDEASPLNSYQIFWSDNLIPVLILYIASMSIMINQLKINNLVKTICSTIAITMFMRTMGCFLLQRMTSIPWYMGRDGYIVEILLILIIIQGLKRNINNIR